MTPESIIKHDICEYLSQIKVFFWVTQSVGIAGRKNNSKWSCKGISDIVGVINGKILAIEVKTPKGTISDAQLEFLDQVTRHGGIAIIARSLGDVVERIKPIHG